MDIVGTAAGIEELAASQGARLGRTALRQAFTRTADALYRFILVRVGGNRHAADDLLQQTCCEAARHRHPPACQDELEAWLWGIARNLVRRHWRDARREADWVPLEDGALAGRLADDLESRPLPPEALIRDESTRQLLLAVTALSAADQRLIIEHYFSGYSQARIARELGVTEKSIESRLYRARGRLRSALRSMERSGER